MPGVSNEVGKGFQVFDRESCSNIWSVFFFLTKKKKKKESKKAC